MRMSIKKNMIIILFLTMTGAAALFGQTTEAGRYFDSLFNNYIELESSVLELIESGEIDLQQITEIENMLLKASEENREDISSRLKMLLFAAKNEITDREISLNADVFISEMAKSEKAYQSNTDTDKTGRNIAKIAIGTAVASGTVFAVSSLVSQNYYEKYLQTEIADQAAFYLFWWQFLDNISLGSAVITIIGTTASGILAVVF